MMRIMWKSNKQAYIWLEKHLGYNIHFSTATPEEVEEAYKLLCARMVKYKYSFFDYK
jgi:hypothetical protein